MNQDYRTPGFTYNGISASTGVSNYQLRGTVLGIIRMKAGTIDSTDSNAVDGVRVAVKVAVISIACSIATSEDVDRAKAATPLLNALNHSPFDDGVGGFHGLSIIGRTPGARVNLVLLVLVDEGFRFISIANRLAQYANAGNTRVVSHPNTAKVVTASSDLASTARAVIIVGKLGLGLRVVIVEVP